MYWIIGAVVLFVVFLFVAFYTAGFHNKRWNSRRRAFDFGKDAFVTFSINPAFQIMNLHWCRARGFHQGWRPNRWGLRGGQIIEDGQPGYAERLAYLGDGKSYVELKEAEAKLRYRMAHRKDLK